MNISKEEKKAEVIVRMKTLGIFSETIQQFETDDKVSISEPPSGAFYWLEGENLNRIRQFEEKIQCFGLYGNPELHRYRHDG